MVWRAAATGGRHRVRLCREDEEAERNEASGRRHGYCTARRGGGESLSACTAYVCVCVMLTAVTEASKRESGRGGVREAKTGEKKPREAGACAQRGTDKRKDVLALTDRNTHTHTRELGKRTEGEGSEEAEGGERGRRRCHARAHTHTPKPHETVQTEKKKSSREAQLARSGTAVGCSSMPVLENSTSAKYVDSLPRWPPSSFVEETGREGRRVPYCASTARSRRRVRVCVCVCVIAYVHTYADAVIKTAP